jgi:CheY-like chemotaxis protein
MKTILAIDDEPAVLRVVRSILESRGYRVQTTTRPVEAAELLAKTPFDLMILDFMMPEKTGIEVFEEVKRAGRPLPILFLTGYSRVFEMDTEEKLRFWREQFTDGLTDVLYKPFENSVLLEKVEGLIGRAEEEGGLGDDTH